MANKNLSNAKNAKNDEFYTQLNDIQAEVNAYIDYDPDVSFANIEKRLERNKKFREKYQQTQRIYETQRPTAAPHPHVAPVQREEPKPRCEESVIESVASGVGSLFTPSGYDATAAQDAAFEAELRRRKKKKRGMRI